jgi:hypothetical protein
MPTTLVKVPSTIKNNRHSERDEDGQARAKVIRDLGVQSGLKWSQVRRGSSPRSHLNDDGTSLASGQLIVLGEARQRCDDYDL